MVKPIKTEDEKRINKNRYMKEYQKQRYETDEEYRKLKKKSSLDNYYKGKSNDNMCSVF